MTAPHAPLLTSDRPLHDVYDVALLDLDGVVYRGPHGVEHAPESVAAARAAGMRMMFVTNNAARSPQDVAAHLVDLGIPTAPDEVTTAAQAAAALIADEADDDTRVLAVGGPGLREAVLAEGLTLVEDATHSPTVVVQGFAPTLTWEDLAEAVYAISAGATHVATNTDATLPTERGMAPGNGSLVAAVVNATGVTPRSTGKPQPEIFHQAARRAGAARPLVVGDRLNTDLAGARAAGYPGLHVLTGVDLARDLLRCIPAERPDFLAVDLRGLGMPHPPVLLDGDTWRCRTAGARSRGEQIILETSVGERTISAATGPGEPITLDELRAACAAAWTASDVAGVPTVLPAGFPQLTVTSD